MEDDYPYVTTAEAAARIGISTVRMTWMLAVRWRRSEFDPKRTCPSIKGTGMIRSTRQRY